MMFHLPYIGLPYYNRYSRYGYRYPYYTYSKPNFYNSQKPLNTEKKEEPVIVQQKKGENNSNSNDNSPLFQLFGLDLYFDDILLICLIWFLYDEGVKDEWLFIALILLLLS